MSENVMEQGWLVIQKASGPQGDMVIICDRCKVEQPPKAERKTRQNRAKKGRKP
jgi:hypothetical protein